MFRVLFFSFFVCKLDGELDSESVQFSLFFLSQYVLINSLEEAAMGHDHYFGD